MDTGEKCNARSRELESGRIPYPIPTHYNLLLFFGFTNLMGASIIYLSCRLLVTDVRPIEWLAIPAVFFMTNLAEYILHRGPMHNQHPFMQLFFRVHTLSHHEYFSQDAMEIEHSREAYKVLLFFRDNFTLLALIAPICFLIRYVTNWNVAGLTLITLVGYFLLYEWLHLAYHAPERYRIRRIPLLGFLARNHQIHHDREKKSSSTW